MSITQSKALDLFHYDDGKLFWRVKIGSRSIVGNRAGNMGKLGYWQIKIGRKTWAAHRIIYLMHHGFIPEFIDHIDCDRSNSRIENLRIATRAENNRNASLRQDNSSGYKGVSKHKATGKWVAQINLNGKRKHLGLFESAEDAALIYAVNAFRYYGEFANIQQGEQL